MHQIEVARAGFISLLKTEITAQNNTFKDEATNEDLEEATEEDCG